MKEFKQKTLKEEIYTPETGVVIDNFLTNFKGSNRLQRGGGWQLAGGGSNTSTFLANTVSYSIAPTANNTYSLGSSGTKWANIWTVLFNGVTPKSGTNTYYVSTTSGGPVDTAIVFENGIHKT